MSPRSGSSLLSGRRAVAGLIGMLTMLAPGFCNSRVAAAEKEPEIIGLELGFGGVYKLGDWTPAAVTIAGGEERLTGYVEATVEDADGIAVAAATPPSRAVGVEPGGVATARLFIRPGQLAGPVTVRYVVDGKPHAVATFRPAMQPGQWEIPYGRAATTRVIALAGPEAGAAELIRSENAGDRDDDAATIAARLESADQFPIEWYGYEAIDTLVLTTSQPEFYRPLAQSTARLEALLRWIELGGRVVLFCGENAEELMGPDGPLAALAPGALAGMAPLRDSLPLETFAESEELLDSRRLDLRVPRWEGVDGRVLAYGLRNPAGLPLVIRSRRSLGEITFVGLDPETPPLDEWRGRGALLRRALGWPSRSQLAGAETDAAVAYSNSGYVDLVNQVRTALDQKFTGVEPASFGLVALLVVVYIALIGPGDYFFVKHVLKRMELTWITFPVIVVGTSLAAYWLANAYKGDQLRVNQVEIVDVDVSADGSATSAARGTVWTHFFNPRVQRYDLAVEPRFAGADVAPAERLAGWLGLAGGGMGGMQGGGASALDLRPVYSFSPDLADIHGTPVQEWSTKTVTARWSGEVPTPLSAELRVLDDDLLAGKVTNDSGVAWNDCLVMHDRWAYRLGTIAPGSTAEIDSNVKNATVKNRLTSATAGDDAAAGVAAGDGTVPFDPYGTDVARLVKLMMFYDAVGGQAYAPALNRYQSFIDLSRLLQGDQAILLVRAPAAAGSRWQRDGAVLASDQDNHWVFYRFVIPVHIQARER